MERVVFLLSDRAGALPGRAEEASGRGTDVAFCFSGPPGALEVALQHQLAAAEPQAADEGGRRRGGQGDSGPRSGRWLAFPPVGGAAAASWDAGLVVIP